MKRLMIALMMIALLASAAFAETREGVIYLEGEPEPITETLYETPWGFSFWYDAETFTVNDSQSESGQSLTVYPTESDLPVYLEIMTSHSVGIPAERYLAVNGGEEDEMDEYPCEVGGKITGFEKFADFNEEIMQGFYVIQAGDDWAAAYLSCPMEAMEGFGRRLSAILETVSFGPLPAVRVEDGEDMEDLPSIVVSDDEYSTWVTFTARRPVRDVQVLSLDMTGFDDDVGIIFDTETVYRLDELNPDAPIRLSLTFYGDIPNNGISFVEEDGTTRRYAVDMSGDTGALYLWEF